MKRKDDDIDLTVLRCGCSVGRLTKCWRCAGTGSIFWVSGVSFPYTPEGEKRAKDFHKKENL